MELRLCACLLAALVQVAPARAAEPCPIPGQRPMLVLQTFFGRGPASHPSVSERQWRRFLAAEVTPRFPGGLTAYDADGQWQDPKSHAITRERSKVLVIATGDGDAARQGVTALADAYKRQFAQQSVGIIADRACAVF